MNRIFLLLCFCFISLLGCTQKNTTSALPPEEVLLRAATASQSLESAAFTATVTFDVIPTQDLAIMGTVSLNGILHDAGKQLQIAVSSEWSGEEEQRPFQGKLDAEIVIASEQEVYLLLRELSTDQLPSVLTLQPAVVEQLLHTWWLLPSPQNDVTAGDIATDPRLLRMQTEIVNVTKNHGIEELGDDQSYHYNVEINKEKLRAFFSRNDQLIQADTLQQMTEELDTVNIDGEVWIDTETFYLKRILWNFATVNQNDSETTLSATVDIAFTQQNQAPPITPPTDAQLLSSFTLLQEGGYTIPEETIRSLNESGTESETTPRDIPSPDNE